MLARELRDGKEDRAVPSRPRTPPRHEFGGRLGGVPTSLGGFWGWGGGITPEGACTLRPSSTRGKQTALNSSVTMTDPRCVPRALHRRAGDKPVTPRGRVGA